MIVDAYNRTFRTLRVSLTNACNLACTYCVSESGAADIKKNKEKALTTGQYLELISSIHKVSPLRVVRLTGGEPLLFKGIEQLVSGILQLGIPEVKLTSNGVYLAEMAQKLSQAGLRSINVSLDAIDPVIFQKITRTNKLHKVQEGIDKALEYDFTVKINFVAKKGYNESQIIPILEYAAQKKITIRFLELMKMGHLYGGHEQHFISEQQLLDLVSIHSIPYPLERLQSATAKYWHTDRFGTFGIISNESDPFCGDCDRLRLDSFGNIYGCLSSNVGLSVIDLPVNELEEKLKVALAQKQKKFTGSLLSMKYIGG